MDQSISNVVNYAPLVVPEGTSERECQQIMAENNIFHLPAVSKEGILVGLHVAHNLAGSRLRQEPIVIMAGGRGKRLMPLTSNLPKPMLPIGGRPMLHHLINRARSEGFRNVYISVNYLAEKIVDYFGDGSEMGVSIRYIKEDKPLGTAGSLSLLPSEVRGKNCVVCNGDIMTDVSLAELANQAQVNKSDGLMSVKSQVWESPYGVVHCKGNVIVGIEEKPVRNDLVNAGIYVVGPRMIDLLKRDTHVDMTDLFLEALSIGLRVNSYEIEEAWRDVGRHSDYRLVKDISDEG